MGLSSEATCAAAGDNIQGPLETLVVWLSLTVCAIALQCVDAWMLRRMRASDSSQQQGGLAASLLPQAQPDAENAHGIKRPGEEQGQLGRHMMLVNAIYAGEDA